MYISTPVAEGNFGAPGSTMIGVLLEGEDSGEYIGTKACKGAGNCYNDHRSLLI